MMFESLTGAYKAVEHLRTMELSTELQTKIGDLLEQLLRARAEAMDLQEKVFAQTAEIRDLKEQVKRRDDWLAEVERYEPKQTGGALVYMLKAGLVASGSPQHLLCAACLDAGKKGRLQARMDSGGDTIFACSSCKDTMQISNSWLFQQNLR